MPLVRQPDFREAAYSASWYNLKKAFRDGVSVVRIPVRSDLSMYFQSKKFPTLCFSALLEKDVPEVELTFI